MESPFFWRTPYSTLNRKELERKTKIESAKKKICTNAHLESLIANISDRHLRALCEKVEG
jgi:hypothetical protein